MTRSLKRFLALVALAALTNLDVSVEAQSVKGGASISNILNSQQQIPITSNQQSESFLQMFNSLTPVQKRQFFNQMSSSNRKIFQTIQPSTNSFVSEDISSSSGNSGLGGFGISSGSSFNSAGTKSLRSSSQQSFLSPAQQAYSIKQQRIQASSVQPTIQPTGSFSFSRQVSQEQQQPIILPQSQQSEFQIQRVVSSQPQPQRFITNQMQRTIQQVAQPVVLPSSEQSYRKVVSFQNQPLQVPQSEFNSGYTSSQFTQQFQPQTTKGLSSLSLNRQVQLPQAAINDGFSSFSQSSSQGGGVEGIGGIGGIGGGGGGSGFTSIDSSSISGGGVGSGFGASGGLQQEKLDIGSISGQVGGVSGFDNARQQFTQTGGGFVPGGGSSFESSQVSSGFDSGDAQQKNLLFSSNRAEDQYGGLTAASINNRWYIMKPVDRPSELGLGDARAASGTIRQVPMARILAASNRSAQGGQSAEQALRSATSTADSGTSTTQATAATSSPKKRATEEKKKKEDTPASDSSSLLEPDSASEDTDENRRRRRRR